MFQWFGKLQNECCTTAVCPKIRGFPASGPGLDAPRLHSIAQPMTTTQIDGVSVTTAANVYFDGKCVSHGITFPDGTKKSVGVILPATLTFNTGAPEIMECVAGSCDYKLDGSDTWVTSGAGDKFSVPGNAKFQIRVTEGHAAYHYICHFG